MSPALLDALVALAILVGVVGIVVPVLPGVLLVIGALLVWALLTGGSTAWIAFGVMAGIIAVGQVLKYLLPHRSMTAAGVPSRSLVIGGVSAIVGFLLAQIIGLVLGFVGGVYLAEHLRLQDWAAARASAWAAMKATGFSILIELASVLLAATVWVGTVVSLAA
ncbi:MAG: DUF456 domain-containing protein [Candidatus Nanopelagicales bacterium]